MNKRILATVVAVLWIWFPATAAIAGGQQATSLDGEPRAATPAERSEAIKAQLASIGIQTFDDDIEMVDFGIPNLAGVQERLSDHGGDLVFLNFWASWCGPCRAEMPSMERLQAQLAELPFTIVAVNVQERPAVVKRFIEENGYTFPVLLDRGGEIAAGYGVRGIPTTFFIGPDGLVLGMLVGTREWDEPDVLDAVRRASELARS